ncbi:MAG: MarR family transcriptional regulator [Planctomycetaceae bacterium]
MDDSHLRLPHGAEDLISLVRQVGDTLHSQLLLALTRCGLTEPRFRVLERLAQAGDQGCSQTEIASWLDQSDSSICGLIDRMQEDSLLYRFRSKVDRRRSLLMLSQEGRARWERAVQAQAQTFHHLLDSYPETNRRLVCLHLQRLQHHLSQTVPIKSASSSLREESRLTSAAESMREAG